MITFDEAIELIRSVATPLGTETVRIDGAAGRVLAAPVVARIDSPRTDVSAMDGYAVRDSDLQALPARLNLVGESFAGARWHGTVEPGTCVRIFTGAPVPDGADRVIMQENVGREREIAVIDRDPGQARHIRRRGSDFSTADELLPAGRLIDARAIVAAAGADVPELLVFRRPRVRILSTGDELAEPGTARERADAIPESVSFGIAALVHQWGGTVAGRTRISDDLALLETAADAAIRGADLIIVTGGASVGEKDFAKTMFQPLGLELVFSKVAIKPGKPVWLGRAKERLVMGLPGNPTSALVTARLLLAPLLALIQGRTVEAGLAWKTAKLSAPLRPCGDRETFHRGRLNDEAVEILSFQDSSAQRALASADLLVRQRANTPSVPTGAAVEVLDF
jgi:molybdopterin molybdotransferase